MSSDVQLTPHFKLSEFLKPGFPDPPEPVLKNLMRLAERLELARTALGNRPIRITSGWRPRDYNRRVGGVPNSQHIWGKAADIVVSGLTPRQVQDILDDIWKGGLGYGKTFTHLDIRQTNVRFRY